MVAATSIDAYRELEEAGEVSLQREIIMMAIKRDLAAKNSVNEVVDGYTRREIQKLTGFEINVVSGRVYDLLNVSLIVMGKRKCSVTGKTVEYLMPKPEEEAGEVANG